MIHGRNLIVALDGVAIAAAKTCSLDMDQSFLEACSPVSGRTHTKIPTTYDWGVSVDGLIANSSSPTVSLQDRLIEGTKCLLTFTDGSGNRRAGFVYVKSCKESGPVGGLATYSASFESTGPLYRYYEYNDGEWPYEGAGFELSINQGSIYFDYDRDRQEGPYAVEIKPLRPGKVYIFTDDVWALYNVIDLAQITQWFNGTDTQALEDNADKWGKGNGQSELDVDYQYCTIVCNTKPKILFLYE